MKHALQRLFKLRKALVMHWGFGQAVGRAALVHNDRGLVTVQKGDYTKLTYETRGI